MRRLARTIWRCRAPLVVLCALAGYAVLVPTAWMYAASARYRTSPARVPATEVGIIFGAGAQNNRPSEMLAARLELGAELYRRGKVDVLLVSGDNSRKDYDEPSVMRDSLVRQGVPRGRIVLDYAGFDTWDSCVRAKRIFGVNRAVLVTQDFHLPRAVSLCRTAGINARGVGDDSFRYSPGTTLTLYVRELPAGLKAAFDWVARPRPYFLGRREPGIARALKTPRT